jgi:formylglycine-generating enzyme required for sulfatase activity
VINTLGNRAVRALPGVGRRSTIHDQATPSTTKQRDRMNRCENTGATSPANPGEERELDLGGGVAMPVCWVPPGSFLMGSPGTEDGRDGCEDETQQPKTIRNGFWMGKYPVTQRQWAAVVGNSPSHFKGSGPDAPVEMVSFDDCSRLFIDRLNNNAPEPPASLPRLGAAFCLPSEAAWEYACRAGTVTRFYTGDSVRDLNRAGWYSSNSNSTTQRVGQKEPNAWGLHDMHGNVSEWCHGGWDSRRALRGGSSDSDAQQCRAAYRGFDFPSSRSKTHGFRIIMTIPYERYLDYQRFGEDLRRWATERHQRDEAVRQANQEMCERRMEIEASRRSSGLCTMCGRKLGLVEMVLRAHKHRRCSLYTE